MFIGPIDLEVAKVSLVKPGENTQRVWDISIFIKGKVLEDFIDQKRDEKMYKKVWSDISVYNTINREEIRRIRRWYTIPNNTKQFK